MLSLGEFFTGTEGERLLEAALGKIDEGRRRRAECMRQGKGRTACVGAGMLLQLTVQEYLAVSMVQADGSETACLGLRVYSVSQVMELLAEEPLELAMDYGEKGKPYLREYPLFFNLSHSGEYVVCAVSDREIGVDIQQCGAVRVRRLAERFFSAEENRELAACGNEKERLELFYRLWVRKEAYGKMSGEGILGTIGKNLLPGGEDSDMAGELSFWEWGQPEGYRIAVCRAKADR